jgi:hypothetical protein
MATNISTAEACLDPHPWPVSGLLRDFPTPPEVVEALDRYCRRYHCGKRDRAKAEQDLKLQYHFGGRTVYAVPTPQGLQILAAGFPDSEEFRAQVEQVHRHGYPNLVTFTPSPWEPADATILTPFLED